MKMFITVVISDIIAGRDKNNKIGISPPDLFLQAGR